MVDFVWNLVPAPKDVTMMMMMMMMMMMIIIIIKQRAPYCILAYIREHGLSWRPKHVLDNYNKCWGGGNLITVAAESKTRRLGSLEHWDRRLQPRSRHRNYLRYYVLCCPVCVYTYTNTQTHTHTHTHTYIYIYIYTHKVKQSRYTP
jgi:hypothetical protein